MADSTDLTIDQLRACAPLSVRKGITQEMTIMVNAAMDDAELKEDFREHVLSWIGVMSQGKYKFQSYVNACKYVTHLLLKDTQQMAWVKTFPDKYQRLVDNGIPTKNISSHVSAYNRSDLVMKIVERTLPPLHVLNSDILQEAINVQATLMRTAKSETVRTKAAANLIEHLKAPEALKVDLNVGVSNDTVEDLRNITRALAVQQKKMIEGGGMTAKGIAEMSVIGKVNVDPDEVLIEAEFEEMEPDKISRLDPLKGFFPGGK